MQKSFVVASGISLVLILISCTVFATEITILAENVDDVLAYITSGEGTPSKTADANSGSEALSIGSTGGDGQNFNPNVPDWAFNIVENPAADDEFRYITFAWKKDGGEGIQLQLHGVPDTWGHRYHAGENVKNWNPSIQVSDQIPTTWTSNTQDLFTDWGAFTLTGIAFSAWDGNAGLWDDVFLHQDPELLTTAVEPVHKLTTTWAELKTSR
ncbi:hypothetical protein IH992_27640 [Candidatus Poribacteria bacterium]|nr:hypothetical protein [Candidatus Poribacteria bacterium]